MPETPITQEQVKQLAGHFDDICRSILRFANHRWDRPNHDVYRFVHDNSRALDRQIHAAIGGVSVLNAFDGRIGGVPCGEWRGNTKYILRQLRKLNKDFTDDCNGVDYCPGSGRIVRSPQREMASVLAGDEDYDLDKGRESFILNILPVRVSLLKCHEDLERLDILDKPPEPASNHDAADDAVKSEPATAGADGAADAASEHAAHMEEREGEEAKSVGAFNWAQQNIIDAHKKSYSALFEEIQIYPHDYTEGARGGHPSDLLPKSAEAWAKNCYRGGIRRRTPRSERRPTGSIRAESQVEHARQYDGN